MPGVGPRADRPARSTQRRELTNREFLYRSAFELGRHLIGYELQKVLAGVDWFSRETPAQDARIGVFGWGEGGMLALYAAALDTRIDAACVSGYFDAREDVWQEPIDRNVFGLLEQFGDAELAGMITPRRLIIEAAGGPQFESRQAPGRPRPAGLARAGTTSAANSTRAERLTEDLPTRRASP